MTVAHVDPFCGASGDMLLGACVDAGAPLDGVLDIVRGVGVDGWTVTAQDVMRGGIGGTQIVVNAPDDGVVRTWGHIRELLVKATLPSAVRTRALAVFERLAVVEAGIHRREIERVHFHEVGGVDAIVDVVGVCAALHLLGVERLTCGPVAQGVGMTRSEHGLLPIPAPAVLALLAGAPTFSTGEPVELCTPTGAALLAEFTSAWGFMPLLRVSAVGYGAGARELDRPNLLRVVVGTAVSSGGAGTSLVLETTVDDLSGELVPVVLDALRAAGASDAWARQVLMKKGRPGLELCCIGPIDRGDALRAVLFRETTTLGVRGRVVDKWVLDRSFVTVHVEGHPVRLKLGALDGEVLNVAPEFEDCRAAAAATGLAMKEVFARARAAWQPGSSASLDGKALDLGPNPA